MSTIRWYKSIRDSRQMDNMKLPAWAIVILSVMIAGCAVTEKTPAKRQDALIDDSNVAQTLDNNGEPSFDEDFDLLEEELTAQKVEINDPLEPLNRLIYHVNDALYFWVLKPCAQTCKAVVPEPARIGIRNFFQNLTTPVRFVNCLLQGKGDAAETELNRFLINTTAGVLGFGDPARDEHGLQPVAEDLGQTLAIHDIGNGFYVVLPLLGPSTVRDSVGKVGDLFLNPVFYVKPAEDSISISAGEFVNESSFRIGEYEAFKSAALDPYVAMRESYIQYRNKQIQE